MKSIFEQNGGTYTKVGDYYIPNLTVPECKPIGKYGMLCREYLENYRKAFYNTLLISGKLNDYLCDVDRQANELQDTLIPKYKELYGVTEQLKAENQMKWVQLMNAMAHQIEEVILTEMVYGGIKYKYTYLYNTKVQNRNQPRIKGLVERRKVYL